MKRSSLVALGILLAMFAIEVTTAVRESPTMDEGVHLSAGLSYWRTGDFRLNQEHPPLMKLVSAIPLLLTDARLPLNDPSWSGWDKWRFGDLFLAENALSPQTLLFLGRLPTMVLSLILGWWIFVVSRSLFSAGGGLLSLTLFAFDPNIIAHSRYVTTDLAFTTLAFVSIYRLSLLLQHGRQRDHVLFFLAFMAAGLVKFSGLPLLVTLGAVLIVYRWHQSDARRLHWRPVLSWAAKALAVGAVLTWAIYGFGIERPANDPRIAELYEQRATYLSTSPHPTLPALDRYVIATVGDRTTGIGKFVSDATHVPVPNYQFFRGLIAVIGHSEWGQESYLLGEHRDRGWWYYFPLAILLKTPLPTLIVGLMLLSVAIIRIVLALRLKRFVVWFCSVDQRVVLFVTAPVVFLLTTMLSNLNLGWRHVMFIYPFWYVLAGWLAARASVRQPWSRVLIPALVSLAIVTQVGTYPNELGYFNTLVGGNRFGPK